MNSLHESHRSSRCACIPFAGALLAVILLSTPRVEAAIFQSFQASAEPTEVTGSEKFRVRVTTNATDDVTVSFWISHPGVIILPDPPSFPMNGTLEVELATAPVSETTVVQIYPISGGALSFPATLTVKPPVLAAAQFTTERVPGGSPAVLKLRLNAPAGDTGAIIDLATNDASALPVPPQVSIEPGNIEQQFPLFSVPVAFTVPVSVTATYRSSIAEAGVLIDGRNMIRLAVDRDVVQVGEVVTGTVEIGVPAPSPGVTVALAATSPAHASVPAAVTILEGARMADFTVTTLTPAQGADVILRAALDGVVLEQSIHVNAASLSDLAISPKAIPGGLAAAGRITLLGVAPPGGAAVHLWGDDSVLAGPPAVVVVPEGASSAQFRLPTARPDRLSPTGIWAQYLDRTISTVIQVIPDAVVEVPGLDLLGFEGCMRGPDIGVVPDCVNAFDSEGDHDVDLRDFAYLQPVLIGGLEPASPRFTTDASLAPGIAELPSYDAASRRLVAAVLDANGVQGDFVEDELILETDSPQVLSDFLARWQGQVLTTFSPGDFGVEGEPQHLVRINPALADRDALSGLLRSVDPSSYGQHAVSSQDGLGLLAAAAAERANGLRVGINWVAKPTAYRDGSTVEHGTGPALTSGGSTPEAYNSSTALWSYLRAGGMQDINVIEAWRMLDGMGRFQNKVRIGILDRGFSSNTDVPTTVDTQSFVPFSSAVNGVGDGDCGTPCPWHATGTVASAMGIPDNNFGAAGPAGPVGELVAVRCLGDLYSTPIAIAHAVSNGARIINMSFSGSVPASLSWSVAEFDALTALIRSKGVLLFAASGNDGFVNVDRESCFITCWESAWHFPCENTGVTCVGALAHNSRNRASYSNYGAKDVDIFGPGTLWTSPDPTTTMPRVTSGTSEASPFVAGVAALVMAANPNLTADQVESILQRSATTSPDPNVGRYVNAYRAVLEAIGGNEPPRLKVLSPRDGGFYSYGFLSNPPFLQAEASDREDGAPTVTWLSSINGPLGTGTFPSLGRELSPGQHVITVTATDRAGVSVTQTLTITIHSPGPRVSIRAPTNGATAYEGNAIYFRADTFDPNGTGFKVAESGIAWSSNISGAMGTGSILPRALPRGGHLVTVTATNATGQSASASIVIQIFGAPANYNPPPSVTIDSVANVTFFPTGTDGSGRAYTEFDLQARACDPEFNPCQPVTNEARFAWFTNRSDLQDPFLLGGSSGRVRLYGDRFTVHQITVYVTDTNNGTEEGKATWETRIPDFGPR